MTKILLVATLTILSFFANSTVQAQGEGQRCVALDGPHAGGNSAYCHFQAVDRCETNNDCKLVTRIYRCIPDKYTPDNAKDSCKIAVRELNCHAIGCAWASRYR